MRTIIETIPCENLNNSSNILLKGEKICIIFIATLIKLMDINT